MYNDVYEKNYEVSGLSVNGFMAKVYGWLFLGLLITAASSFSFIHLLSTNSTVLQIASGRYFYLVVIVGQLALVIGMTAMFNKVSSGVAKLLFLTYSISVGITISYLLLIYGFSISAKVFVMTAGIFGIMSLYGLTTKADLTSVGKLLMVALIGVIISSVVNWFLKSDAFDYIVTIVCITVFIGLTAYDAQKIKTMYFNAAKSSGGDAIAKIAIFGALSLYLDFINLFISLLRLFGRRK